MKLMTIIMLLFWLTACDNRTGKSVVGQKAKTIHIDSLNINSNEINGSGGQPYKQSQKCNFSNFIADKKTPKLAKDIYLDNDLDLQEKNM
ncbi:hypothetical protein [Hymenobacter algoricola]|uniref:Lipoprotein n=1 Tax=Hymenobacter algoricola TaxID=486267 RepID=A0ABP7NIY4_9BACT